MSKRPVVLKLPSLLSWRSKNTHSAADIESTLKLKPAASALSATERNYWYCESLGPSPNTNPSSMYLQ